jgi:hypothetical protein
VTAIVVAALTTAAPAHSATTGVTVDFATAGGARGYKAKPALCPRAVHR